MERDKELIKSETDLLLENGFSFDVKTRSVLSSIMKKKTRKIVIQPFTMGIEVKLCEVWAKLKIDKENPEGKFTDLIINNTDLHCEAMAIAYLGSKWKIRLFKGIAKRYFKNHITPKILLASYTYLVTMCDIQNFTIATILVTDVSLMSPKKNIVA